LRYLSILALALFAAGCFHDPSPTGVPLLPDGDLVNITTYDSRTDSNAIASTTSPLTRITTAGSPLLSIGTADGYEASAVMRWLGWPYDIGDGGTILSATLTLHPSLYRIGPTADPIAFDVRAIGRAWSSFTVTWDSLALLRASATTTIGSYSGAAADSIGIAIDTSIVRTWMRHSSNATYNQIYGMLLAPTSGMNVVQSFHSSDPLSDGSANPRSPSLVVRMLWNGKDTTIVATLPEDAYVTNNTLEPAAGTLSMYGGIARRGQLVPDLRAIPAGSIVNHVRLALHLDSANTVIRYRGIDSLLIYEMKSDGSIGSTFGVAKRSGAPGEFTCEAPFFVSVVQRWINSPQLTTGFVLVKAGEVADLDRTVFHGANAPMDLRPRFVISYTRQQ
jgi:hypothetical protein